MLIGKIPEQENHKNYGRSDVETEQTPVSIERRCHVERLISSVVRYLLRNLVDE